MRALLIGAGMMGRAIAYDLSRRKELKEIILADRDPKRAKKITDWLRDRRVVPRRLDV
ncbi:saccharopine dehydrogenase NADP-binding domain-containing protein, partial [Candidatus Bipolaricaulota bacterium]|nr:saccharopine dehydrogenase NADP-binding domain-containing protein [Candidatus Bipolaricaulota bacterium]